jgi:hypothetical protein
LAFPDFEWAFAFFATAGVARFAFEDRDVEGWADPEAFLPPCFFAPLPAMAGAAAVITTAATAMTTRHARIAIFLLMHSRLVVSPTDNHHPEVASLT